MEMYATAVKFFQDSGVFIYPSLLIMSIGLAIAIERFLFLGRTRRDNRKHWDEMLPLLQGGKFQQVFGMTSRVDTAIGKIVSNGLSRVKTARRREDIDAAMEEGMMEIVPRLEKRTHYIATFANVITLVGLLGTIIGLIKAFTAVAQVNPAEKAELLSASISIAMNNTAFALMVAIPFLLVHAYLQARTSEIVDSLEAAKITFLNIVERAKAEAPAAK
jgi:biopolymer transport protein ExbB/TolQ